MKIMIYEPWGSGHRYHYVRELFFSLSELTHEIEIVFATTHAAAQSNEFSVHLEDIKNLFTLESINWEVLVMLPTWMNFQK